MGLYLAGPLLIYGLAWAALLALAFYGLYVLVSRLTRSYRRPGRHTRL